MEKSNKKYLFEEMKVPKAVMTLAVPTIISQLVMAIYNMADTYFVGLLNNSVQTAGVTLASPVLLAFNAVNNLFGVGGSSMMSRALGRGDTNMVKKSSAFAFYGALISAAVFAAGFTIFQQPLLHLLGAEGDSYTVTQQYLFWTTTLGVIPAVLNVVMAYLVRAEGESLHASIGTMSGCVLNMILDPIFILPWGFNMGAGGAGCATFLSNCFACCYFFVLLAKKKGKTFVSISPKMFQPTWEIVKGVCGVGIPASIQNLLNVTGMTLQNNFMAVYGSEAVAALGIAQKLNNFPFYVALGISQGVQPLVSYNYGSGNSGRMKSAVKFALTISVSFLTAMAVLYFFMSGTLVSLFMKEETVVEYASVFLRSMCFAMPLLATDFLAVGVFQACGLGKYALLFAILRKIVLEIPALIVLNMIYPMYGLAYAQLFAEAVLATAAIFMLVKIFRMVDQRNANA